MNSNSTHVCRLCLQSTSDGDLLNIFEKFQDSTIASILGKHFWFQVDQNDGLPKWVCEICWIQTKTFHNFYKRLESRHKNYLNSIVLVKVDEVKQERSVSPTEEALEADVSSVICKEETDALESDRWDTFEESDRLQIIDESDNCDEDKIGNSCDQSETEQGTDVDDQFLDEKPINGDATVNKNLIESHSQSEVDKLDAQIRKFFRMKCEICSDDVVFDTLKMVREHYRQLHNSKGYLICCGKKFDLCRHKILDHIRYHVNPNAHRCEQCGKSLKNRQALKLHKKKHLPSHLGDYKCDSCPKIYTSKSSLRSHMQQKHNSDKFPCNQCDRICSSKTLLASHIRHIHEGSTDHICETCGQIFKRSLSLQNHITIEHSATPTQKVQCDICGTWLKHERQLSRHLRWHQEVKDAQDGKAKVIACSICKKKVSSKRLLANHIRQCHGERKYRCTFCDKAFKTPTNLKEHEALHTGVDLYSCPYCDRTFKSNANMYSHRKKAHLEEWTRDKTSNPTTEWKLSQVESKGVESCLSK